MKRTVTRLGSPVDLPRLGRFDRNKPREVELSEALEAQLSRGRLWRIEETKEPKLKTKPIKTAKE